LLAVEQLKKEGVSFEIYVYDTGTDTALLNSILPKEEIREMDIFIGPVYTNQVKRVSDYSKRLGIKHIVPFSAQTTETATNPLLFQRNITSAQQAEVAARRFVQNFGTQPIVIVEFNETDSDSPGRIKEFTTALKRELKNKNIAYQSVFFNGTNDWAMANALSAQHENIVILNTSDAGLLTNTISLLKTSEKDFALFGTLDWSNTSGVQEKIFACKLYLYTPFYINATDLDVLRFRQNFSNVFGDYNQSSLPFYNFYGYDVSLYFLSALARYGRDFERNLPSHNIKTLQSHFLFERISPQGGFVNNGLFLLLYEPDKSVVRRPF
jgi:ABC-type branched-subunit amino acid transport system substrate-binding protein